MKKNLCVIFIIALALFAAAGCSGAYSAAENSSWTYRNNYLRDETVGLEDVKEVKYKHSKEYVSAAALPSEISPLTDEGQKRKLDAEIDELTANLSGGEAANVRRHSLAYSAFGIDGKSFARAPRIERNVYPAVSGGLEYTGLFLPAGEIVTVTVDESLAGVGFKIVLNSGSPDLKRYEPYTRIPRLYCEYALNSAVTQIAHPFGGIVEIYVPEGLSGVKVNLSGCVKTGLYRLGIDSAEQLNELKSNPTGVAVFDFGAGVAVLGRPSYERASDIDEALCWWNSAIVRAGELAGSSKKVRLYSDCVSAVYPSRNSIVFPATLSSRFLDAEGLKSGGGLEIVSKLIDLYGDISGADSSSKSAAYYIIGQIEKELTHFRAADSFFEADVALKAASGSAGADYSLMTAAEKSGLNVVLWHFFGAEQVSELLRQTRRGEPYGSVEERREAFALNGCKLFQADLTPLFEAFKFNLSQNAIERIAALGYEKLYPLANKYCSGVKGNSVRNGYMVSGSSVSVDFDSATADIFGVYELIGVSAGDGMSLISDYKYDVSLSEGEETYFELTYKEKESGSVMVLEGSFTRKSAAAPKYAAVDGGARTEDGLYLINPRSSSFVHKGEWVCVKNGAYAGGESLCGKEGAFLSFTVFAQKIVIAVQNDSPRARVKLRTDGGKYEEFFIGGDSGNLELSGLSVGEHKVDLKVTEGRFLLKAAAVDSGLYALDLSDTRALFSYSNDSYSDPYYSLAAALWIVFSLLFCAAAVLLLFAVIFPLINRKKGTDFPTLRFNRQSVGRVKESEAGEDGQFTRRQHLRRKDGFKTASGEVCALDWDDNWVKEVALPPVTRAEKPKEKAVSPVLVADAPLISEMEKAGQFVRGEAADKGLKPSSLNYPKVKENSPLSEKIEVREPPSVVRAQLKPLGAKTAAAPQAAVKPVQENPSAAKPLNGVANQASGGADKNADEARGSAEKSNLRAAAVTEKRTVIRTPALKAVSVIKREDKEKSDGDES